MKKLIIFLVFISSIIYCQDEKLNYDSAATKYLYLCAETGNILDFDQFYKYFTKMSEIEKHDYILKEETFKMLYYFLSILFTNDPNIEIFNTFIRVKTVFKNAAEPGEMLANYFSIYFVNNIKESFKVIEKMNNVDEIKAVIKNVAYNEDNIRGVFEYIDRNNLKSRKFYKIIKEYRIN